MAVDTLLSWSVPVALFLLTLLLLYMYGSWTHSTWSGVGIPGPPPTAFLGNMREFSQRGLFATILDWTRVYGKTYGVYMFRRPFLITVDVDILKEVFIKDFGNFHPRGNPQPLMPDLHKRSLLFTSGETWKRQRHIMTPMFSASKLKRMNRFVSRCCTNLVSVIGQTTSAKAPLDVKKTFGGFTLDVIAGTGFGLETNCLNDETSPFVNSLKDLVTFNNQFTISGVLASIFPALEPLLKMLVWEHSSRKKHYDFIRQTMRMAIEERKKETENGRVDILQLLIDAESSEEAVHANPNERHLSTEEVMAQGVVLFFAGYETTATTLQYLTYLLALKPEKQEKLHDEIVASIGEEEEPSYENVSSISYLDNCIREAMRFLPPVAMFGRLALETRTIKGVTIPAGSSVMAANIALMRDEDYFPEPDQFIPERFEKDSQHQIPAVVKEMMFGAGPRQCIGMRLALYEVKMATVAVLRKFRFLKIQETPEAITFQNSAALSAPTTKILVGTELRDP